MNQRPIGAHPSFPDDGPYLCPNDLLLGRSTQEIPKWPFLERCTSKHCFDSLQSIVDSFRNKWHRDVFPHLVIRQKWHLVDLVQQSITIGNVMHSTVLTKWQAWIANALSPIHFKVAMEESEEPVYPTNISVSKKQWQRTVELSSPQSRMPQLSALFTV